MEADLNLGAVVANHNGKELNINDSREIRVSEKVKIHSDKEQNREEDGMIV